MVQSFYTSKRSRYYNFIHMCICICFLPLFIDIFTQQKKKKNFFITCVGKSFTIYKPYPTQTRHQPKPTKTVISRDMVRLVISQSKDRLG